MDITEFAKMFPQKMAEVRKYVEGEGVKIDMGRIALDHFDENFEKGDFVDSVLNPWKEVERRKPDSPWFGHSGQTGKRSPERMNAPILHGETRELRRATRMEILSSGVRIINSTPYAAVHQFGGKAKIYGKKPFTMPKRPFIGRSKVMTQKIQNKILQRLKELVR